MPFFRPHVAFEAMFLTLPAFCCESRPALGYKPPVLGSLASPWQQNCTQRSLLFLMALSFWIHPGHALPGSAVGADGDRGHCQRSQLSPPGSLFYPYISSMDILPWCQLRLKLEQLAFPQLLPRAGLPWDEVLDLDMLSSSTSSLVPATTSSWSLCRLYMCKIPFPACFGVPACPAQELFPPSLFPSMQWVRAGSCGWGDRRSSSPATICSWFFT